MTLGGCSLGFEDLLRFGSPHRVLGDEDTPISIQVGRKHCRLSRFSTVSKGLDFEGTSSEHISI